MKPNNNIYQVIDSSFVLGFNLVSNKPEYLYHFTADSALSKNILSENIYTANKIRLTKLTEAFIQQTGRYFNSVTSSK